jgi:hydroxymethylbilane synthase
MSLSVPQPPAEHITIGTRASALAMAQTTWVVNALKAQYPTLTVTVNTMDTIGDQRLESPLHTLVKAVGDKGLFTQELEAAMAEGRIDAAVHSAKDLPTRLPDGFMAFSVGEREDARDALLGPCPLANLPKRSIIGTSSLRRMAQIQRLRPDVICLPIRGNLNTRWQKHLDGQCDALLLAAAGVHRLAHNHPEWLSRIQQYFDPVKEMVPAVGQGILAVEYRQTWVKALMAPLTVAGVEHAWQAERGFLHQLEGGCQVPIGGFSDGQQLRGLWFPPGLSDAAPGLDGHIVLPPAAEQDVADQDLTTQAFETGAELARQLRSRWYNTTVAH